MIPIPLLTSGRCEGKDNNFYQHATAAAAAAKPLQSCPTLCDPTDGSPPGSPAMMSSYKENKTLQLAGRQQETPMDETHYLQGTDITNQLVF